MTWPRRDDYADDTRRRRPSSALGSVAETRSPRPGSRAAGRPGVVAAPDRAVPDARGFGGGGPLRRLATAARVPAIGPPCRWHTRPRAEPRTTTRVRSSTVTLTSLGIRGAP